MRFLIAAHAVLIILFISSFSSSAEEQPLTDSQFINKDLTKDFNIHFSGKYCNECHEHPPRKGKAAFLKFAGDFIQLCRCHGYDHNNYIHPVNIVPSEEKKAKLPEELPLTDDKITCLTCHDIFKQCQENQELRKASKAERRFHRNERMFLRLKHSQKRTDLCFKCHDEQKYKKLDPHSQLNEQGEIIVEKCLYCHIEKPDEKTAGFEDVRLIGDLKILCQRCHGQMEKHPGNAEHFRVPSSKMFTRMQILEGEFNIVLPFDEEGKLTCITCHNPHEKGVIPKTMPGAKGASTKHKQRLPEELCKACHRI